MPMDDIVIREIDADDDCYVDVSSQENSRNTVRVYTLRCGRNVSKSKVGSGISAHRGRNNVNYTGEITIAIAIVARDITITTMWNVVAIEDSDYILQVPYVAVLFDRDMIPNIYSIYG